MWRIKLLGELADPECSNDDAEDGDDDADFVGGDVGCEEHSRCNLGDGLRLPLGGEVSR